MKETIKNLDTRLINVIKEHKAPVAEVKKLLKVGADINTRDDTGYTPLLWAVRRGLPQLYTFLTENGADRHALTSDGTNAFYVAVRYDHTDLAKQLLKGGMAFDDPSTNGMTPLCWAAKNGNLELLTLLLEKGAEINWHATDGLFIDGTPLSWAVSKGHADLCSFLIACGADVHVRWILNDTLLHTAAHYGYADICYLLIEAGVPLEAEDDTGRTALAVAIEQQQKEVVYLLTNVGAEKF